MKRIVQLCAALAFTTFIYGCNTIMAATSAMSGHWTLREIKTADQSLVVDAPDVSFTLNLTEDQRANGKVACNSWHGQARIDKDRFQLLAAGNTRKRCFFENELLHKIERTYLSTLQRSSQFSASEKQLQLRFENGDLWIFERQTP